MPRLRECTYIDIAKMPVRRSANARPAVSAIALIASALTARPGSAVAQPRDREEERLIEQLDLQTLLNTPVDVWTPSRTPQRSYQAPSIITTITREQIAVWGFRTMAELLDHLLGFYVVDDHTSPNVLVRGSSGGLYSDSSVLKVLINGHAVSFGWTGGVGLGPELIPLSVVDRVEVIRGPISAVYGANAFLALINIHTRQGVDVSGGTGWVTVGQVGHKPTGDLDASLGTVRGKVEVLAGVRRTHQDLSGLELPPSSPAPNLPAYNAGRRTAAGLYQDSTSAFASVTVRPRAGRALGAFVQYSWMKRGSEFGSLFELANGYDVRGVFSENRTSRWQVQTGVDLTDQISTRIKLSAQADYFDGRSGDGDRLEVGSDYYYMRRRAGSRGGKVDGHLEWTPGHELLLAGGAGAIVDSEELPSRIGVAKQRLAAPMVDTGGVIDSISVYRGRKVFANGDAYLHATWEPIERRFAVTAGARWDQHNIYGGQPSYRAGVVGSPREDLHVKLLHGAAFQAPSPFLLYAVPVASGDVVGNPGLRSQHVFTYEADLEYDPGRVFKASTDLAYSQLGDKTEFVQQGTDKVARNLASTNSVSWESRAELRYPDWLNAQVSVELTRAVLHTGQPGYGSQVVGSRAGLYPRVIIHAGVVGQPRRWPLRLALLASYIGQRRASPTNILLNAGGYALPPYVLLEANLTTDGFRLFRGAQEVSFSVNGKNLLGVVGPTPGLSGIDYPLPPRALLVQMNLTL
jgi:outer membrane receptor for ferrienterochelin and colicins